MPNKTQEYLNLAQQTAKELTRYWENWTDYLTTASRRYKYSFADQLMIYAQRPDATACASFDIWNNRMGEPHRCAETVLTTICAGEEFTAKGKVVLDEGWKGIERKMLDDLLDKKKEPAALPDVQEQSECGISGAELKEGQTSPPKHFTEDTLLHSMETASADSMPEDAERQGIGTPATRAAIIEKLVAKGFLERKGDKKTKVLLPTDKGKALITVMPEEIQSADMTADWETKLLRVERGEMEPETFMTEINAMLSSLVNTTEAVKGASALMKNKVIGVCPNCGKSVVEREKGWFCEANPCRFILWKDNAFFKRLGKRLD